MKLLAIETATEACSAALDVNDTTRVRIKVAPRQHAALILPMIDELLNEADIQVQYLDAIAFGHGPGAFTGIRIATGVIQGLAFSRDIPVIPISTLAALAQQFANTQDYVATALDARIKEVYWGLYKKNECGLMQSMTKEEVCSANDVSVPFEGRWFGAGSGWKAYPAELKSRLGDRFIDFDAEALPSAKGIIELAKPAFLEGLAISVEEAKPIYLRNKVVN